MIHPSSGLVSCRNLTVPFQALWLQPFRQNDRHCGNSQALGAPRQPAHTTLLQGTRSVSGSYFLLSRHHKMGTSKSSSLLLLLTQLPTTHTPPRADPQDPFTQLQEHGYLILPDQRNLSQKIFFKELNQLHSCQVNVMISYTQSPSPAIHCKIWKSRLSLGSLVNQGMLKGSGYTLSGQAQRAIVYLNPTGPHTVLCVAHIYTVLTDYQLKHPLPFFPLNGIETPCALHPACTPQSLIIIRQASYSTYLGEESSIVRFPCPYIGKKQNTPEVWIRKCICVYLQRQNLINGHILMWN